MRTESSVCAECGDVPVGDSIALVRNFAVYCCGILNEGLAMVAAIKRKTSLTLDAEVLDAAKALEINVSAVAEAALKRAVAEARRKQWLHDNADNFAAQAAWHERNGHPLAEIMCAPGATSWNA
ncbi:type II toxin-antitoxin system CcdA family antitoxin [Rhodocyclaceae bacterium SMB388]